MNSVSWFFRLLGGDRVSQNLTFIVRMFVYLCKITTKPIAMKKILLMAAFAGMLGTAAVANTFGDDKDKGKNKKECKKDAKACAGEKKEGCAKGEAKACCKKKA